MRASMSVAVMLAMAVLPGTAVAGPPDEGCLQPRVAAMPASGSDDGGSIRHVAMRISHVRAGAGLAEVGRVMGQPTSASLFQGATGPGVSGKGCALVYADEPVRTDVTLVDGRVTSISLDLLHIESASLPARARQVKPMMERLGVLALLGRPVDDDTWLEDGRAFEQMIFVRPGASEFTVILSDGLVVSVRPGRSDPGQVPALVLPSPIADNEVGNSLGIGLRPKQAAAMVGPMQWKKTSVHLAGEPVIYATHREPDGNRLVSMTFIGDGLTAFAFWNPTAPRGPADGCCLADP